MKLIIIFKCLHTEQEPVQTTAIFTSTNKDVFSSSLYQEVVTTDVVSTTLDEDFAYTTSTVDPMVCQPIKT